MRTRPIPRAHERGQTLPIWTFAIFTALTLMFFALNYANVLRWQVRAQNAADAAATAALSVQATQWNKMTSILYAADVEEWRIRQLMQALIDVSNFNGGCTKNDNSCLRIYQSLQPQYWKAVNRYTTLIGMLQSLALNGAASQASDAKQIIRSLNKTCATPTPLADCAFSYHIIDYSYRTTNEQAGKDAFYVQLGGFTSPQDTTPAADWEPARMEIATCATVPPLIPFSLFGFNAASKSFTVIGRSAATNITETAEWFAPGETQVPGQPPNTMFQNAEVYDTADDTFGNSASPRDWYQTDFPSIAYVALPKYANYWGTVADDFEVMVVWWAAIPYAPYTTAPQSKEALCTQS